MAAKQLSRMPRAIPCWGGYTVFHVRVQANVSIENDYLDMHFLGYAPYINPFRQLVRRWWGGLLCNDALAELRSKARENKREESLRQLTCTKIRGSTCGHHFSRRIIL